MAEIVLSSITTIGLEYDAKGPTLGNIRTFLELADKLGIPDDTELLDCVLSLDVPTKGIELIMCGEHTAGEEKNDIIIYTHNCYSELEARQLAEDKL